MILTLHESHPLQITQALLPSPLFQSATSSRCCDRPNSDGEDDIDYVPPSDGDEEYRPTQAASFQKQRKRRVASQSKSPGRKAFSPACSTSTEPESSSRTHRLSYRRQRCIASCSLQCDDGVALINKQSDFQCPVVGCDYTRKNHRVLDLRRHVTTRDRWIDPDRWTCYGVAMGRICLYGMGRAEDDRRVHQYWSTCSRVN